MGWKGRGEVRFVVGLVFSVGKGGRGEGLVGAWGGRLVRVGKGREGGKGREEAV